jgi:hypothetical protein
MGTVSTMSKKEQADNAEETFVDDVRVGVGPHDNRTPAQEEQDKLDAERVEEIEEE